MDGARWYPGLPPVTLAELDARRRALANEGGGGARRRAVFEAASEAVERAAPHVPEAVYVELYEALQRVHDLV